MRKFFMLAAAGSCGLLAACGNEAPKAPATQQEVIKKTARVAFQARCIQTAAQIPGLQAIEGNREAYYDDNLLRGHARSVHIYLNEKEAGQVLIEHREYRVTDIKDGSSPSLTPIQVEIVKTAVINCASLANTADLDPTKENMVPVLPGPYVPVSTANASAPVAK